MISNDILENIYDADDSFTHQLGEGKGATMWSPFPMNPDKIPTPKNARTKKVENLHLYVKKSCDRGLGSFLENFFWRYMIF